MTGWELAGWVGNCCYFGRFAVQWVLSERARASVTPRSFWWLSIAGATLHGGYVASRSEWILFGGYAVTFLVYARNLWIEYRVQRGALVGPVTSTLVVVACGVFLTWSGLTEPREDVGWPWIFCASVGTAIWSGRFLVQWRATEQRGRSHFPASFWWLSLVGSALMLAYVLRIGDAVLIASYLPSFLVPVRNLMLTRASGETRTDGSDARP